MPSYALPTINQHTQAYYLVYCKHKVKHYHFSKPLYHYELFPECDFLHLDVALKFKNDESSTYIHVFVFTCMF